MIDKVTKLIELADQAAETLAKYKETDWAAQLQKNVDRIRAGDFIGVEQLLGALGDKSNLGHSIAHLSDTVAQKLNDLKARQDGLQAEIEPMRMALQQIVDLANQLRLEYRGETHKFSQS
jgi:hypothetical protein